MVIGCKTTGKIIVNLKIQEEAIASSCLMLATPIWVKLHSSPFEEINEICYVASVLPGCVRGSVRCY